MRVNIVTDNAGNLVAATAGAVVESEQSEQIASQPSPDGGGVVLMPGQTVRQADVPDKLFSEENLGELRQHLLSTT